jgi:hypothetical protein
MLRPDCDMNAIPLEKQGRENASKRQLREKRYEKR